MSRWQVKYISYLEIKSVHFVCSFDCLQLSGSSCAHADDARLSGMLLLLLLLPRLQNFRRAASAQPELLRLPCAAGGLFRLHNYSLIGAAELFQLSRLGVVVWRKRRVSRLRSGLVDLVVGKVIQFNNSYLVFSV